MKILKSLILIFIIVPVCYSWAWKPNLTIMFKKPMTSMVCIENGHSNRNKIFHIDRDITDDEEELLEQIHGVQNVFHHDRYKIDIYKGEMFEWYEIQPKILDILNAEKDICE